MNLLDDEADYIARRIIGWIGTKGAAQVYAKPSGTIALYSRGDARNETYPDAFRVGVYNKQASVADIAEDLKCRRAEIAV